MKIIKPYFQIVNGQKTADSIKPKLALIHGWGLHGGIWQTIIPALSDHFEIINIDLPGFGQSAICNGEYSLDYLVESVISVLPEKCTLLGWSMGGLVATAIAEKYPEKLENLITVASSPCFLATETNPYGMKKEVLETFINYLSEDFRGTLIKFLSIQTMGSPSQKADIQRLKETVFLHGTPAEKALAGGLELLKNIDLSEILNNLKMPLLRIYGKLDTLVPAKSISAIDALAPNSIKKLFLKSGHSPFLSQSQDFIETIVSFTDVKK